MISYHRDSLEPDTWEHPDIKAFKLEHSRRYHAIWEREWDERYSKAGMIEKATMLCEKQYIAMLMAPDGWLLKGSGLMEYFRAGRREGGEVSEGRVMAVQHKRIKELQAENAALRKIIAEAPHEKDCDSLRSAVCSQPSCGEIHERPCNCWKGEK